MINGENVFGQSIKNNKVTYENIIKTATGHENDYTPATACLLSSPYVNAIYKMIAADLSKQQALDVHPRTIQQISFTANLDYNVMINGENVFHQPTKDNKVTYENIIKAATGHENDYTPATACLLSSPYVNDIYKMIAADLSKQQALDAHPRTIRQINFTANLDRAGNTKIYVILEEAKETILNFAQGTVKVL